MRRFGRLKRPSLREEVAYFVPEGVCRATIVAPERGAPLSSVTVPRISEVVSWEYPLKTKHSTASNSKTVDFLILILVWFLFSGAKKQCCYAHFLNALLSND